MIKTPEWWNRKVPPLGGFFTLLLLAGAPPAARAFEIAPSYQLLKAQPGKSVDSQLTLTNTDQEEISVEPEAKDWQSLEVNRGIKVADWLSVDKKMFFLKPGQSRTIKFSARVPKNAHGELMGMLSFATKKESAQSITFKLSSAVYVEVVGTQKIDAHVDAITIQLSSNTQVGLLVINRGNIHVRPHSYVQILNEKKSPVGNVVIAQNEPVFPGIPKPIFGTIRNFRLPAGTYTAQISMQDTDHNMEFQPVTKKFSLSEKGELTEK